MIRWRSVSLCIAIIAFVVALPSSQRLKLDRSLTAMFAPDSETRQNFERLESIFGVSDLVVFAYRDKNFWNKDGRGVERLSRIRARIESLRGVDSTMELSRVNSMVRQWNKSASFVPGLLGGSVNEYPVLDEDDPLGWKLKLLFEGQTHSSHSDLIAIACLLKTELESSRPTIDALRRVDIEDSQPVLLAGQRVMIEEGFEEIERDGRRLGVYSAVSLAILLGVVFRSLRWALIMVVVIQWSLVMTRCLLVLLDWELTMVSSMLSSIVTVIGVATTMHWLLAYQRLTSKGLEPEHALRESLTDLRTPIIWACVTDAIGFLSLGFAKVGPVQDYGWMMAIASLVVLAAIFLLVPGLALLPLGSHSFVQRLGLGTKLRVAKGSQADWVSVQLIRCMDFSCRYSRPMVIVTVLVGLFAIWGSLSIEVETDFIKNFKRDSPLVQAYNAIENELGGAGVWDAVVAIPKSMSPDNIAEIRALEADLRNISVGSVDQPTQLTMVMSIIDADETLQNPLVKRLSFETRLLGMAPMMGDFFGSLVATDKESQQRYLRIMLRSREQVSAGDKTALIQTVSKRVAQADRQLKATDPKEYDSRASFVSGYYVLLAELVSSVVADQWRCFAVATIGIWFAMAIALRSIRLACLAIVPNAIPSLCILGWFGWTGTPVNLGAAMIAAVSIGLSVDSSIHYLTRFRNEIRNGGTEFTALYSAQSDIGLAVLLSTTCLVVGFGALASSDFLPTVVFGATAAISMFGGLLGNLVLLPAMLRIHGMRSIPK